ncbi:MULTISPECIES: hypothetical protein [Roseomonadaceae]|uniref:Sialate O-acetylesterase domain-containing protein n=1 Tax=Falsiroseomonas oleicola TaxID=2801474 RepID=A0ABS6HCX0_9PROT|nr:hypothetical protein [Roseomonas oleicola]MBU8545803.1 hypothetical protein [Roseomonas oleicola]
MSESTEIFVAVQLATDLPVAADPMQLAVYGTNSETGAVEQTPVSAIRDASVTAAEGRASIVGGEAGTAAGAAAGTAAAAPAVVEATAQAALAASAALNAAAAVVNAGLPYLTWQALSATTPANLSLAYLLTDSDGRRAGSYRYYATGGGWTYEAPLPSTLAADLLEAARLLDITRAAVGRVVPAVDDYIEVDYGPNGGAVRVVDADQGERHLVDGMLRGTGDTLERLWRTTHMVPAIEDYLSIDFAEDDSVLAAVRRTATGIVNLAIDAAGVLAPIPTGDDVAAGIAGAVVAQRLATVAPTIGPAIQDLVSLTVAPDGSTVEYEDRREGQHAVIGGEFRPVIRTLDALWGSAPRAVPAIEDLVEAAVFPDGRVVQGIRTDGRTLVRDEFGALVPAGGVTARTSLSYSRILPPGLYMPDPGIDVLVIHNGQSLNEGFVDTDNANEADAYSTDPIPNAFMPAPGMAPGTTPFSSYVPLRAIPSGGQPNERWPFECVRRIQAAWAAAGWTVQPRIIVAGVLQGGNPFQRFARGSDNWQIMADILRQCRDISRAAGRRLVCFFQGYVQGEANRGGGWPMSTEAQFTQFLVTHQMDIEALCHEVLGQFERVPLITTAVQRTNTPAFVSTAASRAVLLAPGRVLLGGSNYALEYAATGAHSLVPGYRRMGWGIGGAALQGVFGHTYRLMHPRRWWMHDATTVRVALEMLVDGDGALHDLEVDTSGDLVEAATLGASAGWNIALDRAGSLSVTGVTPINTPTTTGPTLERGYDLALSRAPEPGLQLLYASSSVGIGGALGGRFGPRGLLRANNGGAVAGLGPLTHTFHPPWELT